MTNFIVLPEKPTLESVKKIYYLGKEQEKVLDQAWEEWEKAENGDPERVRQLMKEVEKNAAYLISTCWADSLRIPKGHICVLAYLL